MDPDVSGNKIVWYDREYDPATGWNYGIYLCEYNSQTGCSVRRISFNKAPQKCPVVDGDWVVWLDSRDGTELYLYDLATNTERRITFDVNDQGCPDISGNRIIWSERRDGNSDIFWTYANRPPELAPIGNKSGYHNDTIYFG